MEHKSEYAAKAMKSASYTANTMAKEFGDTIVQVLDRLEGKQSSIKLSFEDLTIDTGIMKGTVTGAVILTADHPHK